MPRATCAASRRASPARGPRLHRRLHLPSPAQAARTLLRVRPARATPLQRRRLLSRREASTARLRLRHPCHRAEATAAATSSGAVATDSLPRPLQRPAARSPAATATPLPSSTRSCLRGPPQRPRPPPKRRRRPLRRRPLRRPRRTLTARLPTGSSPPPLTLLRRPVPPIPDRRRTPLRRRLLVLSRRLPSSAPAASSRLHRRCRRRSVSRLPPTTRSPR